jgi:hypothetical protein
MLLGDEARKEALQAQSEAMVLSTVKYVDSVPEDRVVRSTISGDRA